LAFHTEEGYDNNGYSEKRNLRMSEIANDWSLAALLLFGAILPPKYRRTVSGTSLGKVAFRCSGVRGAKNRPIAGIFVVGIGGKPPTKPVALALISAVFS
jgi:hypothetical protein